MLLRINIKQLDETSHAQVGLHVTAKSIQKLGWHGKRLWSPFRRAPVRPKMLNMHAYKSANGSHLQRCNLMKTAPESDADYSTISNLNTLQDDSAVDWTGVGYPRDNKAVNNV